jgi:putative CocE/NonD family hydrolase
VTVAGPVKMSLFASTDGPDTDWMVKLVDVSPGGYAMNVAEGILRARFRNGLTRAELLKPGSTYEFTVDMVGTAVEFQKGHRIRVDIMSSNFPQFSVNPNTGEALATAGRGRKATNTVFHGGAKASAVILPVVAALP